MRSSSDPIPSSSILSDGVSDRESLEVALRQAALCSIENQEMERERSRNRLRKMLKEAFLVFAALGLAGFAAIETPHFSWPGMTPPKTSAAKVTAQQIRSDAPETETAQIHVGTRQIPLPGGSSPVQAGVERGQAALPRTPTSPSQPPGVHAGKRVVKITATHELGSWLDLCSDGQVIARKYLPQQATLDGFFSNEAVLRLGNSGGVEISVDGTPIQQLGRAGQPRVVQFDASGSHLLTPDDPASACGKP